MKLHPEFPPLCHQFSLPDAFPRIEQIDTRSLLDRASANFRRARDNYLRVHGEHYGGSRDFACVYSQRTHDQLQGQFSGVYNDMVTLQAVLYAFLEVAFERIDKMESGRLNYCGVWKEGEEYPKGSVTTFGGNCWHANELTSGKPGADPEKWVLMVRRGRDGRDAR